MQRILDTDIKARCRVNKFNSNVERNGLTAAVRVASQSAKQLTSSPAVLWLLAEMWLCELHKFFTKYNQIFYGFVSFILHYIL